MMRRLSLSYRVLTAALLVTAAGTAYAQAQAQITGPGFALTAPKGWKVQSFAGSKYKIAVGPIADKFAANINVVDEAFPGNVQQYADANEKVMTERLQAYKRIDRGPFKTTSGLNGVRITFQQTQDGNLIRQRMYFLPGKGGKMFVLTGTDLHSHGTRHDAAFESAAKSFKQR